MKKFLFTAAALLLVCGCTTGRKELPAAKLVITSASKYQIVIPDAAAPKASIPLFLTQSGKMLQGAFKEGLGMDVPVVTESKAAKGVKAIYIGDTKAARAIGIDASAHSSFGFTIAEENGNIFILETGSRWSVGQN